MDTYDLLAWSDDWGIRECEGLTHRGTPPVAVWSANVPIADGIIATIALCDACANQLEGCAS